MKNQLMGGGSSARRAVGSLARADGATGEGGYPLRPDRMVDQTAAALARKIRQYDCYIELSMNRQ
jgi:hypothetical protein